MYAYSKKLRLLATLSLMLLITSLFALSAQAQDAVQIAHRVLRQKIMREAGDRYAVRFLTTHTDRLPGGLRTVTGRGRFQRRGTSPQNFTYHATVDPRRTDTRDVGYDIR